MSLSDCGASAGRILPTEVVATTPTDQHPRNRSSYLGSNGSPIAPHQCPHLLGALLNFGLGGPLALRARVASYRAAKDCRATEPPSASRPIRVTAAAARNKGLEQDRADDRHGLSPS